MAATTTHTITSSGGSAMTPVATNGCGRIGRLVDLVERLAAEA